MRSRYLEGLLSVTHGLGLRVSGFGFRVGLGSNHQPPAEAFYSLAFASNTSAWRPPQGFGIR